MVTGVAEVAYQNNMLQSRDQSFPDELEKARSGGPEAFEAFLKSLEDIEISHDVHFDLEEYNSEFWMLVPPVFDLRES